MIFKTKNSVAVLDAHKSKAKTSIAQIGSVSLVVGFTSLGINMDSIITAITTANSPSPTLRQFLLNFIRITHNTEWVRWHDLNPGCMPNLHWYCYSFFKKIFNHMADFATDFGNVSVVSEGCPISDLNIQPIIRAARAMKAFEDNVTLHQSLDTPIAILPSSIEAYTLSPWNKTNICHNSANTASPCDDKRTGQDDYSHEARGDTASHTNAGDKRNPTTPKGKAKPSQTHCQKKQHCTVANDNQKHQNTDMGMFWLHSPRIRITDIFPANLPEKVCMNF